LTKTRKEFKSVTSPSPKIVSSKSRSLSPGLASDRWINIPALDLKFRFKLPLNCNVTKSIQQAQTHASKIATTAEKQADGETAAQFGLLMNDGPIDDTMSAHSLHLGFPPNQMGHRHQNCKHGVSAKMLLLKSGLSFVTRIKI